MDIIQKILLFLHLLGMAYLVGGLLIQVTDKKKVINRGIMDGTIAQLITGSLLFWIALTSPSDEPINHIAITAKIILLLIMITIVLVNRKSKSLSNLSYYSLLVLALSAVGFAIFVS